MHPLLPQCHGNPGKIKRRSDKATVKLIVPKQTGLILTQTPVQTWGVQDGEQKEPEGRASE